MRLAGGALLIVALSLSPFAPRCFAQEIYLGNGVIVAGEAETLGSAGLIAGGTDTASLARLLSAPLPVLSKHPALIPARDLREELAKRVGGSFVLVGGPIIYLPASVSGETARLFYTSLLQEIEKQLGRQSLHIEVWAAGGQQPDLSGIQGPLRFEFPAGSGSPYALIANSYVMYRGAGATAYRYLPLHVRVRELVPVARHEIPYGTQFSSGSVSYVAKEISTLSGTPAQLSGAEFQARSNIGKGGVIYADMVGKVQIVKAGQQIRISFRKGSVAVTVPGSAYQSGGIGDTIAVAPSSTGRQFEATIVGPSEAVVED